MILIAVFALISALSTYVLKLEESSIGINLFFFELIGIIICLYTLKELKESKGWGESFNFSLKNIKRDLKYFITEFLNFWVMDAPPYFIYEVQNAVVSFTYSNEQIAAYSINSTLVYVIYSMSAGFTIEARTMINREIGKKDYEKVARYLNGFKIFFGSLAVVITTTSFLLFFSLINFGFYGEKGTETRSIMNSLNYVWIIRCFIPIYNFLL